MWNLWNVAENFKTNSNSVLLYHKKSSTDQTFIRKINFYIINWSFLAFLVHLSQKQQKCPSWKKVCSLRFRTSVKKFVKWSYLVIELWPHHIGGHRWFFFSKRHYFLVYYFKTQNSMLFRTNISWAFLHTTEALMLQVSGSAGKVTPGFIPHYTNLSSLWKIL